MKKTRKLIIASILILIILGGAGAVLADDSNELYARNKSERHQQMEKAINNNDFNLWKQLMGNRGVTQKITEQNFSKFVEMHKLMEAGKLNEADKIRQELGLGQKMKNGRGAGCRGGMTRGNGNWNLNNAAVN